MRYKITARLRLDPTREYVFYTTLKETDDGKESSEQLRKAMALKDAGEQVEQKLGNFMVIRVEEVEEVVEGELEGELADA